MNTTTPEEYEYLKEIARLIAENDRLRAELRKCRKQLREEA
jgi:regulator of replication initiation timing